MIDLLAIGGAHIDRTVRMLQPHIAGASNPVRLTDTVGGGAFNALRVAHFRGLNNCAMMSVRGGDAAGSKVETEIDRLRIADFSGSFIDRATPTYTAVINIDGQLITALADMALYDDGFLRQVRRQEGRERICAAKHILIDANLPSQGVELVCAQANGPIFAMAISPAKVGRLMSSAAKIDTVFLNRRELDTVGKDVVIKHFKRSIVTDGAYDVEILDGMIKTTLKVPKCDPAMILDVTGAGDALAGGTIAAMLRVPSKPIIDCV